MTCRRHHHHHLVIVVTAVRVGLMLWLKCRRGQLGGVLSYRVDPTVELGVRHISPMSHPIDPDLLFLVSIFCFSVR